MKRFVLILFLVLGAALVNVGHSSADPTMINGFCFASPNTELVPCPMTPTPTSEPATPNNTISLSGPTPGPDGTTAYDVSITSQLSCFSLAEPTLLYTLGSPSAAALTELYPNAGGASGSSIELFVDQHEGTTGSGTADVSLEVANQYVGPEGLNLKAVWPVENVEQIVTVVPPAIPTDTPTPVPGQTDTPVPADTATPAPTATATASPTAAASPTPQPFFARACVEPSILEGQTLGGDTAVLHGLSIPGASCGGVVLYLDGTAPADFDGSPQSADANGMTAFPFTEGSTAGGGVVQITCTLGGHTAQACSGFLILQKPDSALTTADKQKLLTQIQGLVGSRTQCATVFPQ